MASPEEGDIIQVPNGYLDGEATSDLANFPESPDLDRGGSLHGYYGRLLEVCLAVGEPVPSSVALLLSQAIITI